MDTTRGDVRARRGPRVFDLLILVGVSAFGLFWIRAWAGATPEFGEYLWIRPQAEPHSWLLHPLFDLRRWAIPVLGPLSIGVLVLMLRPPRPPRSQLLSRPGTMACLIASSVTLTQWGVAGVFGMLTHSSAWWFVESTVFYGSGAAGMAVAMGWSLIALLGRWRPSAGWRDRAGRVLGAAWIVVWLASLTLVLYPRYAPLPADRNPTVSEGTGVADDGSRPESHRRRGQHRVDESPIAAAEIPPRPLPQTPDLPEDER